MGAEVDVRGAKFFAEGRFLVEADKEMDAEEDGGGQENGDEIGAAENNPEADPAGEEADVHGIADVAVQANNN